MDSGGGALLPLQMGEGRLLCLFLLNCLLLKIALGPKWHIWSDLFVLLQ